jgi:transpeptidase family protein
VIGRKAKCYGASIVALLGMIGANAADNGNQSAGPCAASLENGTVCEAANERALELMRHDNLEAIAVLQNVGTGALVAFAASDPAKFNVTTQLLPLSPVKLMAAAAWLEHAGARDAENEGLLADSIISGNDNAGRKIAGALRHAAGTEKVLEELARYGFPARERKRAELDTAFWAELAPRWRTTLIPTASYHSLGKDTSDKDWEDTLSIGEERFVTTALHLSRFLQAVGNAGIMLPAVARAEPVEAVTEFDSNAKAIRIVSESAAVKLQEVMRGTVERGTAKSARSILAETDWTMGGKTGTGPDPSSRAAGPGSDGCFAGLIFDPQGKARFTVVTFVKHGGLGGSNAARISAELARFLGGAGSSR